MNIAKWAASLLWQIVVILFTQSTQNSLTISQAVSVQRNPRIVLFPVLWSFFSSHLKERINSLGPICYYLATTAHTKLQTFKVIQGQWFARNLKGHMPLPVSMVTCKSIGAACDLKPADSRGMTVCVGDAVFSLRASSYSASVGWTYQRFFS